jgi:CheY-like chemotaxis protein
MNRTIVAIDDEAPNLLLIEAFLAGEDYDLVCFQHAAAALDYLRAAGAVDVILLDRMMPDIDGLGFMQAYRTMEQHRLVPVIMQTAASAPAQVAEGIAAGAYYYLTKPYSREVVKAVLSRALSDHAFTRGLQESATQVNAAIKRIETIEFGFRSLPEVRDISSFLASLYPEPRDALLGIREIMLNAVEHGNLGITYQEKTALMRAGKWQQEVERRLCHAEYSGRTAFVRWERDGSTMVLTVEDMGAGFDWTDFMTFDVSHSSDPHGRGIAMSRLISFSDVTYQGCGNKVVCRAEA